MTRLKRFERAAKREDGAESFAFVHLAAKRRDIVVFEFVANMLQSARTNRRVCAGEQNCVGNRAAKGPLLLANQLDGLGGFGGVELGTLGRNDHKIGSADCVGHRHRGRAFQIDNHRRASLCGFFNRFDDR